MTVIKAPRMIPRIVSSLMFSPARSDSSRAILFPPEIVALAAGCRRRVTADRDPAVAFPHPDVGRKDAVLDDPAEIFELPARMHRSDNHVAKRGDLADLELDRLEIPALNRIEPFVPMHHE